MPVPANHNHGDISLLPYRKEKEYPMSKLVVVAYPNELQAEEVRLRLLQMQKEYLVDLEDAAIAVRKTDGKVKLLQLHNLTGAGLCREVSGAC